MPRRLYLSLMEHSKSRSSRPQKPAGAGDLAVRPPRRSMGSAHVIDLRQKAPSSEPSAPVEKNAVTAKKRPHRQPQAQEALPSPVTAPVSPAAPAPAAPAPPRPKLKQAPEAEVYTDAAFPSQSRFWPAFWRFLFLLILLGLIIALGVYIYFSYYQS